MEPTDIERQLLKASKKLRDYAYSLTHDLDRTDDLLQETFLRILNNTKHEEDTTFIEEFATPLPDDEFHTHCGDTPTGVKEIYKAIDNLPEKSAKAMRLFISGHKYIEISVIMQIPIGTVKTRINKSREKLKKDLKDYLN